MSAHIICIHVLMNAHNKHLYQEVRTSLAGYDFYLGHCLWLGFPVDVMLDDSDLDQEMRYRLHAYVELTDQLIVPM